MGPFAALWRLDGGVPEPADLASLATALAVDGPVARWEGGPVALVAASAESLSFVHAPGGEVELAAVADARLDNRAELSSELGTRKAVADAELIVRAFGRWGERAPGRLLGDYAFAVWDARRRRLFCARDRFGVRPLAYCHRPGAQLALASRLRDLLALGSTPRELDEGRLADFLVPALDSEEDTFFTAIRRFPRAQAATWAQGAAWRRTYWELDPDRDLELSSDEEYAEAYLAALVEAVRCRTRDGPVGAQLSGGLDSSSLVAVARAQRERENPEPLPTFSAVSDLAPEADERRWIEPIVRQGGIESHLVEVDALSPLRDLDAAIELHGEPWPGANLYVSEALYLAAARAGVSVLLDGFDGDTTISHGWLRLADLARSGRLPTLLAELRALRRTSARPHAGAIVRRFVVDPLIGPRIRRAYRLARPRTEFPGPAWIDPDFARRVGLRERVAAHNAVAAPPRSAREDHYVRLRRGMFGYVLELAYNHATAAGIEPVYPFCDSRLAELCLAMPADQKLAGGYPRVVARRAMAGLLPDEVTWRPTKSNVGPMWMATLAAHDGERIERELADPPDAAAAYIDIDRLREVARRHLTRAAEPGGRDLATLIELNHVVRAVHLLAWLRRR